MNAIAAAVREVLDQPRVSERQQTGAAERVTTDRDETLLCGLLTNARVTWGKNLLAEGDYRRGFELMESRTTIATYGGEAPPRWHGESLCSKSITIIPEAGAGDAIQFCRWLPLLKRRFGAGHVVAFVPEAIGRLFWHSFPGVQIVGVPWAPADADAQRVDIAIPFRSDFVIELLSLPHCFEARLDTIPKPPYLRADPADIERWRSRLPESRGLRVGLVWKGSQQIEWMARWRSLPSLSALAPLWRVPGVAFVSLQKGAGEDEARASPLPLVHLGSDVRDFADTAAVIESLDLVISVDTSVAHLAGALGKPCWVVVPHVPDWRWHHPGSWYPHTRTFRQHAPGDWSGAVEDVAAALTAESQKRLTV